MKNRNMKYAQLVTEYKCILLFCDLSLTLKTLRQRGYFGAARQTKSDR